MGLVKNGPDRMGEVIDFPKLMAHRQGKDCRSGDL